MLQSSPSPEDRFDFMRNTLDGVETSGRRINEVLRLVQGVALDIAHVLSREEDPREKRNTMLWRVFTRQLEVLHYGLMADNDIHSSPEKASQKLLQFLGDREAFTDSMHLYQSQIKRIFQQLLQRKEALNAFILDEFCRYRIGYSWALGGLERDTEANPSMVDRHVLDFRDDPLQELTYPQDDHDQFFDRWITYAKNKEGETPQRSVTQNEDNLYQTLFQNKEVLLRLESILVLLRALGKRRQFDAVQMVDIDGKKYIPETEKGIHQVFTIDFLNGLSERLCGKGFERKYFPWQRELVPLVEQIYDQETLFRQELGASYGTTKVDPKATKSIETTISQMPPIEKMASETKVALTKIPEGEVQDDALSVDCMVREECPYERCFTPEVRAYIDTWMFETVEQFTADLETCRQYKSRELQPFFKEWLQKLLNDLFADVVYPLLLQLFYAKNPHWWRNVHDVDSNVDHLFMERAKSLEKDTIKGKLLLSDNLLDSAILAPSEGLVRTMKKPKDLLSNEKPISLSKEAKDFCQRIEKSEMSLNEAGFELHRFNVHFALRILDNGIKKQKLSQEQASCILQSYIECISRFSQSCPTMDNRLFGILVALGFGFEGETFTRQTDLSCVEFSDSLKSIMENIALLPHVKKKLYPYRIWLYALAGNVPTAMIKLSDTLNCGYYFDFDFTDRYAKVHEEIMRCKIMRPKVVKELKSHLILTEEERGGIEQVLTIFAEKIPYFFDLFYREDAVNFSVDCMDDSVYEEIDRVSADEAVQPLPFEPRRFGFTRPSITKTDTMYLEESPHRKRDSTEEDMTVDVSESWDHSKVANEVMNIVKEHSLEKPFLYFLDRVVSLWTQRRDEDACRIDFSRPCVFFEHVIHSLLDRINSKEMRLENTPSNHQLLQRLNENLSEYLWKYDVPERVGGQEFDENFWRSLDWVLPDATASIDEDNGERFWDALAMASNEQRVFRNLDSFYSPGDWKKFKNFLKDLCEDDDGATYDLSFAHKACQKLQELLRGFLGKKLKLEVDKIPVIDISE